jgi:hypothetical protein
MPYELNLAARPKKAGWKVKIRDAERLEEPHVTIIWKFIAWRLSLRTGKFLEEDQSWKDVDEGVREAIEAEWGTLQAAWDALYPHNPVSSENDDDDD